MTKHELIAGLDEVGMGSLAGPLVVCVAAFHKDKVRMAGVRDSKTVSSTSRKRLIQEIVANAAFIGLGYASSDFINLKGLSSAWQLAADMALEGAPKFIELIVDGTRSVDHYAGPQTVRPKADITHWQVSAASIVAKVIRDSHMTSLTKYYPHYAFDRNAGYGTKEHIAAIQKYGPTLIHRKLFLRKIMSHKS
jgi:ribonuclease HII